MNDRYLAVGLTAMVVALSGTLPASAQTDTSQASQWTAPRTADGRPNLQGILDFRTITPLERPSELAGKEVLTLEEAAHVRTTNADRAGQGFPCIGWHLNQPRRGERVQPVLVGLR